MRHTAELFTIALFVIAISLATGCSAYRAPSVSVVESAVTDRTDEAIQLQFDLRLENPNDEPIELEEFRYAVNIDGRPVYEGRRAAQATLSRNGSATLQVPAVIRYDHVDWAPDSPPANAAYRLSGRLLYVTPGELAQTLLDLGVRRPKVGFNARGEVDLSQSPQASARRSDTNTSAHRP